MPPWFVCAAAVLCLASARAEIAPDASIVGVRLGMTLAEANAALQTAAPGRALTQGSPQVGEVMGECGVTHIDRDRPPGRDLQQEVAVALNQKGQVWCIWRLADYSRVANERRLRWQDFRASLVARYGVPTLIDESPVEINLTWLPASPERAADCQRQVEAFEDRRGQAGNATSGAASRPPAECTPMLSVHILLSLAPRRPNDPPQLVQPPTVEMMSARLRDTSLADMAR